MIMRTISEKYLYRWLYIPGATTRYYSSAHFPSFEQHDDATVDAKRRFSNGKNGEEQLTQPRTGWIIGALWTCPAVVICSNTTVCCSGIKRITTQREEHNQNCKFRYTEVGGYYAFGFYYNCPAWNSLEDTHQCVRLKLRCLGQGR